MEIKAPIASGNYSSELVVNGKRDVPNSAWLQWFFPGPDLRYNWGSARLHLDDFDEFERELDTAYATYRRLRDIAPAGTEIREDVGRFVVVVGSPWFGGVRLFPLAEHSHDVVVEQQTDLFDFKGLLAVARTRADALREVFDESSI